MTTPTPTTQWAEVVAKAIDQRLVDKIVATAQNSNTGLGNPDKENAYDISQYGPNPTLFDVAMVLVSAHFQKYDLVSLMVAAMEVILSIPHPDTARAERLEKALRFALGLLESEPDPEISGYTTSNHERLSRGVNMTCHHLREALTNPDK